jgi:branched-chain amino acid transport system substrate-binding protein
VCCRLLLAVVIGACGDDGNDRRPSVVPGGTLTVYASLPQRGESQHVSRDLIAAQRLAWAESRGRVGRFRIRYVPLDNSDEATGTWDADRTSLNARAALRDETTIAYLGESDSGATAISLPILNEAGILQVSATATYVGLTRSEGAGPGEPDRFYPTGQRTYGRVVPADDVQAAALATLMDEENCFEAFLVDDGEPPGQGLAALVQREARARELDLVGRESVDSDPGATRALADRIERADADCLLLAATAPPPGAAALLRVLAAERPAMEIFGPAALDDRTFLRGLGAAAEQQLHVTTPTLAPTAYPQAAQRFFRAFRTRYGRAPAPEAIYGYEAMRAVLQAIADAGELGNDRAEVINAFFGLQDRDSVLGRYDIDDGGDTTLSRYGANRVRDGRLVFDRVVEPDAG